MFYTSAVEKDGGYADPKVGQAFRVYTTHWCDNLQR